MTMLCTFVVETLLRLGRRVGECSLFWTLFLCVLWMLHIEMTSPLSVHELFYILWWSSEQEVTLVDLTCPACILTCQVMVIIGVSELLSFVTVPCNVCWVLLPLCTCWQVQLCWACCFKTRTASAVVDRCNYAEPVALRQEEQVQLLTGANVLSLLL